MALDPRDPTRQTYLGSPPRINAELAAIYRARLAAHPGATADERMRLLTEARAEYAGPVGVQYFDTTFSVDKTISLAHASALASAVEAQQAGDLKAAGLWEARAAGIWAEIETSVRLYASYMQGQGGYVRTGHHGRRINGVETGRFEDARDIPVAIFPQHASRNGDRSCTSTSCGSAACKRCVTASGGRSTRVVCTGRRAPRQRWPPSRWRPGWPGGLGSSGPTGLPPRAG